MRTWAVNAARVAAPAVRFPSSRHRPGVTGEALTTVCRARRTWKATLVDSHCPVSASPTVSFSPSSQSPATQSSKTRAPSFTTEDVLSPTSASPSLHSPSYAPSWHGATSAPSRAPSFIRGPSSTVAPSGSPTSAGGVIIASQSNAPSSAPLPTRTDSSASPASDTTSAPAAPSSSPSTYPSATTERLGVTQSTRQPSSWPAYYEYVSRRQLPRLMRT